MYIGRSCVIIPVYNEKEELEKLLPSVINLIPRYIHQTIVVDDGSNDNTADVAYRYRPKGVILLRHERNRGKASALKTGIEKAVEIGYDPIILMDGDGQHSPDKIPIPLILEKLYEEKLDLVVGARNFNKMPRPNKYANINDSKLASWVSDSEIRDSQSGFKIIRSRLFKEGKLNLMWKRFTLDPQITIEAILKGYNVGFIDIPTIYYSDRKSKIRIVQQGIDYSIMYTPYIIKKIIRGISKWLSK